MCLFDSKRFRFTLKPIKCYKVVVCSNNCDYLYSPYTLMKIKSNVIKPTTDVKPTKSLLHDNNKTYKFWCFGEGFIHGVTTLERAYDYRTYFSNTKYNEICILECEIPRFTRYALEEKRNEICARKMKIVKTNII